VEQQTYFTQAAMYWAYAEAAADENTRSALENMGNTSYIMSLLKGSVAENAENRAQTYENAYYEALSSAAVVSKVADYRSTGALIFNVSAAIASCAVLAKRRELLYVYVPLFAIGAYHLIMSLL